MTAADESPLPFTSRDYRDVMSLFPTGVAIVTTTSATGERLGATVSSFVSISLDPPLIAFSLSRQAKAFDAWVAAPFFCVNLLEEGQADLSTRFARAWTDKWEGLDARSGQVTGLPLLDGALASLECRSHAQYDGGDHVIMLGRVLAFSARAPAEPRPLVFFKSRYRQLDIGDVNP